MLNKYWFYAAVTILCWGIGNVFTRVALQSFAPCSVGFLRYLIASLILAALVLCKKIFPPKARDIPWFILSGFCGFAFYMVSYNMGYVTVTAATGSVISATIPPITALLARFALGERLRGYQWAAIAIQFCGILLIALSGGSLTLNTGVLWLLASAVSLAVYNLLQRKLSKSYSAMQCSIYSIFFGFIMLMPFSPRAFAEIVSARPYSLFAVAFLGIFASVVAFLCWTKAFSLAENASQVSNFMFITPLISTLFEMILLNDIPSSTILIGGAAILLGALLFNLKPRKKISV